MRGEDAYKEDYEHIELFDEPGLFTNGRIDRETVPAGWYCYDLRGSDNDPNDPTTVEEQVTVNHAGTVLLPKQLKLNKKNIDGTRYRKIGEGLNFLDGEITLEEFCKEHELAFPERNPKYKLKPMSADEFGRLGSDDETTAPYAIGHVRIDFGRSGTEFWNTWWPKNEDKFNTPAFKTTLKDFIDDLRAVGPLRDRRAMEKYCTEHMAGKRNIWLGDVYAYTVETDHYRFGMRFDPRPGMYDCYLYAYDLDEQRRLAKERAKEQFETRAELITRLGESMIRHLIDVSEKANAEKIDAAHAIRDYLNVHYHLVKEHQFTNAEVEALLEFADPLEVATACWEANTSADFDICDMLDKINAKSDYPLADGTVPEPYIPDGLPELCFSVLPGTGKLICIKRGESGYYPSDWETGNAEKNRETADYANEQLGITKEQELAMLHGSMVGWDTPGADPKTYENPPYSRMLNPKPKHKRQDKER